jgi:hypothetical protein
MLTKTKTERDPKVYGAIVGLKQHIKNLSKKLKQQRLRKIQKDYIMAMEVTVALRHYLRLRGKDYEDVHKIREGLEYAANRAEKRLQAMFNL